MPSKTSTNGFILAGGASRRMGQDKASLKWGNGTLLEHMVLLLSTVAEPIRIVGREDLPDVIPGKGPLGGLLTALQSTDREANLCLAVDIPLLTPDFLVMFHSRFLVSSRPLLACRIGGNFPLCLGIRRELLSEVARRVADHRLAIRALVEESNAEILEEDEVERWGFDAAMFANLNTPKDWERLVKRP